MSSFQRVIARLWRRIPFPSTQAPHLCGLWTMRTKSLRAPKLGARHPRTDGHGPLAWFTSVTMRLETERLLLRDHEPQDLESYCEIESDLQYRWPQPVHSRAELERGFREA
jgi:hypothetical protein